MIEMDWLFRATVYRRLIGVVDHVEEVDSKDVSSRSNPNSSDSNRSDNDVFFRHQNSRHYVDEEVQKTAALVDYIHRRLRERRWNDVSGDEDTPNRPPQSLWPHIRTLGQQIWLDQAKDHYLAATVTRFESLFLTFDPMDIESLSNELLKRNLDHDAIDATQDSSQQQNPLIPFSIALEISLGKEEFADCLNVLRELIFHRVRTTYVEKALQDFLPLEISAFITSCNNNPRMTLDDYYARESNFISECVPFIAAQEKVHVCCIIHLLDTLKELGHIQLIGPSTL